MTDKEQIMIDGVDVSGCLFYQSNFEEDYDVIIKHFCSNWYNSCESSNNSNCYFKQLARKTQECEELKRKVELMKDCPDCKVDEYKKALDEIEKVCLEDTYTFADGTQIRYDALDEILTIINKAKEGN